MLLPPLRSYDVAKTERKKQQPNKQIRLPPKKNNNNEINKNKTKHKKPTKPPQKHKIKHTHTHTTNKTNKQTNKNKKKQNNTQTKNCRKVKTKKQNKNKYKQKTTKQPRNKQTTTKKPTKITMHQQTNKLINRTTQNDLEVFTITATSTTTFTPFPPVFHDWCNKGRGMCYLVCGMVHIKEPLLLIGKSSLCGGSGFPFSLSEWSLTICLTPYNRR